MKRVISRFNVAGAIVLIGSALASASIHAGTDPEAGCVLRHAAAAAAADEARWSSLRFIRVKGKLTTSGLSGTLETLFDARTGHYRNSQQLGPVSGADVFDVLRVTPTDGRPMEEWFDARSHLLARTVEQAATRTTTTYFSDYRRVLGALVAHTIRQTTGENNYDVFLKIESASPEANPPATAFTPPASSKVDFGISSGGPADRAGLKGGDNIVSVDGRVAGREMSLPDFRQYVKGAPGTSLTLNVLRGNQNLEIRLILRDLV